MNNKLFDYAIGLGQGGGRISSAFSKEFDIDAIYLNLSEVDRLKDFQNGDTLIIPAGGSGRDPEKGEQVVGENKNRILGFLDDKIRDSESILLSMGLSGGSGAGLLFTILTQLMEQGKRIFLIAALPLKNEALPAESNALVTLERIERYLDEITVLLVDNNLLVGTYGKDRNNYWGKANRGIATVMQDFVQLTDPMRNYAYGSLDFEELKRVLFSSGYIDFKVAVFDGIYSEAVEEAKFESLLCEMDVVTAQNCCFNVKVPSRYIHPEYREASDFVDEIAEKVKKMTHSSFILKGGCFDEEEPDVKVSLLLSGLSSSSAVSKTMVQTVRDIKKYEKKKVGSKKTDFSRFKRLTKTKLY